MSIFIVNYRNSTGNFMSTPYEKIYDTIKSVAKSMELPLKSNLSSESILLESGLDSLGFAIVVSTLEEEFGFDPFSLMSEPIYPKTLGEFVEIYVQFIDE